MTDYRRFTTGLILAIVCVVLITCTLFVAKASAAPPCGENFSEVFGECYAMNRWDFTLSNTQPRQFTSFGEGTTGTGAAADAGSASDAGSSPDAAPDAGPSTDAGPSGDSGDGGDSGGDGDGPGGCAY